MSWLGLMIYFLPIRSVRRKLCWRDLLTVFFLQQAVLVYCRNASVVCVGNRAMDIKTAVLLWLASIVASLFMLSISSLVFFWLGNEKKGTIVYLLMVIVTAFTYVLAYWNVPVEKIVALGPWKLLGIGCVISLSGGMCQLLGVFENLYKTTFLVIFMERF